jgi:glucose-1-phosphate cytidylyltransferase
MKAVILAGGFGTRISEESTLRPKPMVEIGDRPILWHIMKMYAAHGVDEFIICCGYKSSVIKRYFAEYWLTASNLTLDLGRHDMRMHGGAVEPWIVHLVETGADSMTGGRLRRVRDYVGDEAFHFTYGDCVSDVDLTRLAEFHREEGGLVTLTAVQPPGRFGVLTLHEDESRITTFQEKPFGDGGWINGGFFVVEPEIIDYIEGDQITWEREPLERLSREGRLVAYRHFGYWQNMDTLRDKMVLEEQWASGAAPWRVWDQP